MTDETLKKLASKLEGHIATLDKLRADLIALQAMAEGHHPVKEVLTHFDQQWRRFYAGGSTERYEFTGIDTATVKRWLKTADVRTITIRIDNFFNDREDWLVKQKHPFALLATRYNRYKVDRGLRPWIGDLHEAGPVDCQHDPPCATDVQHTARRREELHG